MFVGSCSDDFVNVILDRSQGIGGVNWYLIFGECVNLSNVASQVDDVPLQVAVKIWQMMIRIWIGELRRCERARARIVCVDVMERKVGEELGMCHRSIPKWFGKGVAATSDRRMDRFGVATCEGDDGDKICERDSCASRKP
ncbi:hypothetical protein MHU86_124 [Fragilaria crotonensis]|nr:hypothetical protein MHU86_124 [Fragilaria crotonensis]